MRKPKIVAVTTSRTGRKGVTFPVTYADILKTDYVEIREMDGNIVLSPCSGGK